MNIVSKNFSIYLNNSYNYKDILSSWTESFTNVYEQIRVGKYLSKEFRLKYDDYPKYPLAFKYIKHSEKYDLKKIRESFFMADDDLIDSIDVNNIGLKSILDKFPSYEQDLVFDINLQRTFFTTTNELYNKDLYFLDHLNTPVYQNLMYSLIGSPYESKLSQSRELQISKLTYSFTVLYFLSYIMPSICDIKYKLPYYIIENAQFTPDKIHTEFDRFLNLYTPEHIHYISDQNLYDRTSIVYDDFDSKLLSIKDKELIVDLIRYDDQNGPPISEYIVGVDITLENISDNANHIILDTKNNNVILSRNAKMNKELIASEVGNIILRNVYNSIFPSTRICSIITDGLSWIIGRLPTYYENFLSDTNADPLLDISELLMSILFNTISIQQLKYLSHDFDVIPKNDIDDILSMDRETEILSIFLNRVNDINIRQHILIAFLYKMYPVKFLSSFSILLKDYVENELMTINENFLTEDDTLSLIRELDNSNFFDSLIETFDYKLTTAFIFNVSTEYHVSRFVIALYFMNSFDEFIESEYFNSFITDILKYTSDMLYKNGFIDKFYNWYECIDPLKLYFKSMLRYNLIKGELFKNFSINLNEDILYILQESNFDYDKTTLRTDFRNFLNNRINIKNIHNFIKNMYLGTVSKQIFYDVLKYFHI